MMSAPDPGVPLAAAAPLTPRATRLAAALEDWPRRTVALTELWSVWAAADPASAAGPTHRADLAHALTELVTAGLVAPSRTRDTTAAPPLPTRLTLPLPAPSPSATALARAIAWRPELAWAASTRLTLTQVEHLRRVNTWLRDHAHDDDRLPLRERSLEVLGHEKALDRLLLTGVFAPGRLTLDLLRTFRAHPPLPSVRVGDGPVAVVAENGDTFHSLRTVLAERPGPVGHVAWGAGSAYEASVRSVADLPGITRVRYFGDLDADGLRIPRNAAATAAREDLPAVLPATALYRRLLVTGVKQHGQPHLQAPTAADLAGWLDDADLVHTVTDLLTTGQRIPQEALTLRALRVTDWTDYL